MVDRQRHMPPWKRTIAMRTSYLRTTRKRMKGTFLEAKLEDNCEHCNAKKFESEPSGFIVIVERFIFPPMRHHWNSCDCGRARTLMLAFGKEDGHEPGHLELYFYDDDPSLEHRLHKCREKSAHEDREVIQRLKDISHGINPYSENLRSMGQVDNLEDYHVELNLDQQLDQRTHNVPLTSEVAAVWIEGSERRGQFDNSVVLQGKDRSIHGIWSYHGCYDALSYPLFFPRGELGWHNCIPKVGVTMAEVDKARAIHKMRIAIFNPILYDKRLFQQFTVDTYVKIESSHLDYIRNNQGILRADLYQGLVDSWHTGVEDADEVVFRAKLEELKKMLMEKDILGKRKYKITCPEQYDLLISAELPNKKKYLDLYRMVTKHMMHGPCGMLNPLCPCTRGRTSCKNHYPWPFCDSTLQGKDLYPIYRRRDDGHKEIIRGHILDNQWVVPYNPYLLRTFNCHINVEACSSIKSVKYLFKYIYKGHDRASMAVREAGKKDDKGNVDEITQYREARWVTPPEMMWRIYGFDLSKNHPPVQQLQLHLPDMHMVTYHKRDKIEWVVKRPSADESMLTAKNAVYQVGRLVSAHPAEGERYFLRVLLNHVAGATSYRGLRTVDDVLLPSFREAAKRRGLIEEDNTLDECLTKNNLFHMPSSLRRLFTTILVFCEPNDVFGLWTKHLDAMSEDYRRNNPNPSLVEQMVLIDIRNMLQSMGKDIRSFPLPGIDDAYDDASGIPPEIFEEASIDKNPEDVGLSDSLNEEQRAAYEEIMSKVDTEQGGLFFVDGPSGTGKTFLYRALLGTLRNQNKLAITTATSGVASSIMLGGRTAHSRFKIPLTLEDGGCCSFTKQSGTAKLLKTAVFGGDFRRVLLVVRIGSRAQIVDASLWRSYLWESMHHLKLVHNMRAQSDPWFVEYLLRIGGGMEEVNGDGDVCLRNDICVPYSGDSEKDLDRLIECIFPNLNANMTNKDYITSRAILSS
ncbi:hypothetical protein SETIT_7G026600v2 [Setaria italica]|uniref:ATP-dependent DNA helicase n=1 Tax=Setaria italica TaxID=4555 RepID=A0A368RR70_SETIT|nr:hypothetical protein SETIT_7G026600v2 [Setaria italica]